MNTSGVKVVEYTYDAWGNPLTVTGSMATTLGQYNPLRYRGYVYDVDTGLYYLQSRYYNPKIGRFINADGLVSTGQGVLGNNMFAYCGNNPVNYVDPTGQWLEWLIPLIALLLAGCEAEENSPYGAAEPYTGTQDPSYNCYAYALGETQWKYVGGKEGAVTNYDIDIVAGMVLDDAQRDGIGMRPIDSYDSPIESNEYRIVLRTSGPGDGDYHFMVQHSDGSWSGKLSHLASIQYFVDDPTSISWDTIGYEYVSGKGWQPFIASNYYCSDPKYFAVTKKED